MVGGGKEGVLYVLDRNNLGHFRSADNSQIVQSFQASSSGRMNGSPVFWNGPGYGPSIYLWPAGDPLKVYRLVDGRFITPASAQSTVLAPGGMPGGMLSLSANGGTAGTGILWATVSISGDANHTPRAGILRAFDASNLTRELWNSEQNATRDALGLFSKFAPPTIADGKVFVPTLSNKLVVYGLLAPSSGNTAPTANAGVDQTITPEGTSPAVITLTGTATDDGNPNPPAVLTTTWSLASGPGAVTFGSPNALTTTASFTVPGTYIIRLSAFDGEATSERRRPGHGERPRGFWHRTSRAVFQRRRQRRLFHRARADAHRRHRQLHLDGLARSGRAGRQLLGALERTGAGAGQRHLHVQHALGRWRAPVGERTDDRRQLGRIMARRRTAARSRWSPVQR